MINHTPQLARPTLSLGAAKWATTKGQERRLEVNGDDAAWMCRVKDKLRNKQVRASVKVAPATMKRSYRKD